MEVLKSRFEQIDVTTDRDTYIGSSESHELLNETQYGRGCARALGYRKTHVEPDFDEGRADDDALFLRGHILEPVIADIYMEQTGRKLIRTGGLKRHPRFPWAGVHTDRMVLAGSGGVTTTGDAEIKSHAEGPFLNIMRNGLPAGHIIQAQWAMFITEHEWCAFIILGVFGSLPLRHFDIERDDAMMRIFEERLANWGATLYRNELPEPLSDPNDRRCKVCPWRLTCRGEWIDPHEMARIQAEKNSKTPLVHLDDPTLVQALQDYEYVREEMKALDSEDEEHPGALQMVSARIKELVGENEHVVAGRWKAHVTASAWTGLDQQRLRLELPEVYEKYVVRQRPTGNKRLRVVPIGTKETGR